MEGFDKNSVNGEWKGGYVWTLSGVQSLVEVDNDRPDILNTYDDCKGVGKPQVGVEFTETQFNFGAHVRKKVKFQEYLDEEHIEKDWREGYTWTQLGIDAIPAEAVAMLQAHGVVFAEAGDAFTEDHYVMAKQVVQPFSMGRALVDGSINGPPLKGLNPWSPGYLWTGVGARSVGQVLDKMLQGVLDGGLDPPVVGTEYTKEQNTWVFTVLSKTMESGRAQGRCCQQGLTDVQWLILAPTSAVSPGTGSASIQLVTSLGECKQCNKEVFLADLIAPIIIPDKHNKPNQEGNRYIHGQCLSAYNVKVKSPKTNVWKSSKVDFIKTQAGTGTGSADEESTRQAMSDAALSDITPAHSMEPEDCTTKHKNVAADSMSFADASSGGLGHVWQSGYKWTQKGIDQLDSEVQSHFQDFGIFMVPGTDFEDFHLSVYKQVTNSDDGMKEFVDNGFVENSA